MSRRTGTSTALKSSDGGNDGTWGAGTTRALQKTLNAIGHGVLKEGARLLDLCKAACESSEAPTKDVSVLEQIWRVAR